MRRTRSCWARQPGGAKLRDLEGLAEEIRTATARPDRDDDGFDDRRPQAVVLGRLVLLRELCCVLVHAQISPLLADALTPKPPIRCRMTLDLPRLLDDPAR